MAEKILITSDSTTDLGPDLVKDLQAQTPSALRRAGR